MVSFVGAFIWLPIGAIAGWLASKVATSRVRHPFMTYLGVGALAAEAAGFSTSYLMKGAPSDSVFFGSTAAALLFATFATTVFRWLFPAGSRLIN